jgi:hypothetical protein
MAQRKAKPRKDKAREERIMWEIVPDAHDSEERAMGWWSYLEDCLKFPFPARCIAKQASSPLKIGDEVQVIGLSSEGCEHDMLVTIRWGKDELAVPLAQLKPGKGVDAETCQAVEDWHYWLKQGYEF